MGNFDRIVEAGKSFACSLYKAQPGALIPNPISDVLRLSWDSLCGDNSPPGDLPSPPAPPFSGGQCFVLYEVTYQITDPRNPSRPSQTTLVYGPIFGAVNDYSGTTPTFFPYRLGINASNSSRQPQYYQLAGGNESTQALQRQWTIRILSVRRTDGQPDNCGSLPSTYPPAPPPPSGGYTSPPTSITFNDGDDFTAVFNLVPPSDTSDGPPPICLSVIVSGVEVKLCFPFGLPPSFGGGDNDIGDVLTDIQNSINNLQDDVDNLQDDFDKFTDPPPPESDPGLNETDSPKDDGGESEDLPGLKWVLVRLTTLPVKSQFGTPSVNFAGWITFKVGGDYTDRVPIAFENGVFQAPPGATGYAITFTNMAKGISKAYTRDITP